MTLGRWDEAERQLRVALGVDPLNPYVIYNMGANYYGSGRFAEAEVVWRELLTRFPDFPWTHAALAATLLAEGKAEPALEIVQQIRDEGSQLIMLHIVLHALGRHAEADAAQHDLIDHWAGLGPFWVAQAYAYRGAHDLAMEWLERAYRQKDVALIEIVGDPFFESMTDDPRFKAFLRKMKLPEWPKQSMAVTGT
jgi:tetratricopeptide (TPR) repeat protein